MQTPSPSPPSRADRPAAPSGGPLYKEIKRRLTAEIAQGRWRAGQALPAEIRLASRFGVSIGTLRKAVDELVAENILLRQQGRGTFVTTHDRERLLFYFFHIVREDGTKSYPELETLAFGRGRADAAVAERLRLRAGDPVILIRNRLSLEGTAIAIDELTLPAARFRGLTAAVFSRRPSTIYNLYQDLYGISVARTSERLRATLADRRVAALLGVTAGSPLLAIRRVAYAVDGEPVELRLSQVDTAHHEYWNELGRAG